MENADSDSSDQSSYYSVIAHPVKIEIKVKGSRFISFVDFVENKDQCERCLINYQKKYYDASHVCFAYQFGVGDKIIFRYSDAGEPAGTAGAPIYNVIKGFNLTNLIVTIIRYFGGTKLGIGGLIRAYTEAAQSVLNQSKIIQKEIMETVQFQIGYDYLNPVMRELSARNSQIIQQDYSDLINFFVSISVNQVEKLRENLINISSGKVDFFSEEEIRTK